MSSEPKDGVLKPILDLSCLNHALMRRPFNKLTIKQILVQIRNVYISGFERCLGVRANSTRGMAWVWSSGISITDTCAAAGWSLRPLHQILQPGHPALQAQVVVVYYIVMLRLQSEPLIMQLITGPSNEHPQAVGL